MKKDFQFEDGTNVNLNDEESDIIKITLHLADGTTKEIDKGMIITTKRDEKNHVVLVSEMCNMTGKDVVETVIGMTLLSTKMGLADECDDCNTCDECSECEHYLEEGE